jgi:hypothetical protein
VRFHVHTAVSIKNTALWDAPSCYVVEIYALSKTREPTIYRIEERAQQVTNTVSHVFSLAYSSTLKTKTEFTTETSLKFYQSSWCQIDEDSIFHRHCKLYK